MNFNIVNIFYRYIIKATHVRSKTLPGVEKIVFLKFAMNVNELVLNDFFVGNVWLASRQPNMQLQIRRITDCYDGVNRKNEERLPASPFKTEE